MKPLFLFILCFYSLTASFTETRDRLTISLWGQLEAPIYFDGATVLTEEEVAKRLLEEARLYFSSMIYGFRFNYTPYDSQRQIQESFELSPVAEIKWGDPNLQFDQLEVSDNRLYVRINYSLDRSQSLRHEAWQSNTIPYATGSGEASLLGEASQKRFSFDNALKDAIRNHAKKLVLNKPKEIAGEILLSESPLISIRKAAYCTTVKVKLKLDEIIPYQFY